jgi:hypothetical protein
MKEYDSAGNEIKPSFLYPCPARCGSTGGCGQCNARMIDHAQTPISQPYPQNELTQEEEERFYKKVFNQQ